MKPKIYDNLLILDITSDLKERLKNDAKKKGRGMASLVREILDKMLDK